MRSLVNSFGTWFDSGQDAFDEAVRFLAILGITVGLVGVLFVGCVAAFVAFAGPPSQPQLFCRNGTDVHSEPTTRVIGKAPVAGVRFTCGD